MSESPKDSKNSDNQGQAIKEELEENNGAAQEANPAEDKVAQLEKDYLYLRAEFENYKRQAIKERSQLLKYGAERLAFDLLDTLDVFSSALASDVKPENIDTFVKGIELTAQSLKNTLEKHGIKEMDCKGKPFDPNTQEALSSEATDELPEGHVTQVFKSPYQYHDKLLRAGQVIVSRAKSE